MANNQAPWPINKGLYRSTGQSDYHPMSAQRSPSPIVEMPATPASSTASSNPLSPLSPRCVQVVDANGSRRPMSPLRSTAMHQRPAAAVDNNSTRSQSVPVADKPIGCNAAPPANVAPTKKSRLKSSTLSPINVSIREIPIEVQMSEVPILFEPLQIFR